MNVVSISGWAYPADSLRPMAEAISPRGRLQLLSVTELAGVDAAPAEALATTVAETPGPCLLVGWSMGAIVALEAIACHNINPDFIALIAPTARFCSTTGYPHGVSPAALKAMRLGMRRDRQATLRTFFRDSALPQRPADEELNRQLTAAAVYDTNRLSHGLDYLAATDLRATVAGITCPALVIHGNDDRIVPVGAGRLLAESLPGAELATCRDAGHDLPLTRPDEVAAMISRFLVRIR